MHKILLLSRRIGKLVRRYAYACQLAQPLSSHADADLPQPYDRALPWHEAWRMAGLVQSIRALPTPVSESETTSTPPHDGSLPRS